MNILNVMYFYNIICLFVFFACVTFCWNCMIFILFWQIPMFPVFWGFFISSFVYVEMVLMQVTVLVLQPFCDISVWSIINSDNFYSVPFSVGFGASVMYSVGCMLINMLINMLRNLPFSIKKKKMVRPKR